MQGDSHEFNKLMAVARSNHLYAQFLLGWISLPASEARCKEAVDVLLSAVSAGDSEEARLLRAFMEVFAKRDE